MTDLRLKAVYDAASYLLVKNGYANTQVSQIAKKANIATGSIYNLFSGKKSILHFVLMSTFVEDYLYGEITLPIKEVDTELIIEQLSRVVNPLFDIIEDINSQGVPVLSFDDMLSHLFDFTAKYHVAFSIINDNRSVLIEVENKYSNYVNRLYAVVEKKLLHYIECGEVREIEYPELHMRNIFEGITWWAMYLPYQAPEKKVSVAKAKEIALDILKHAYMY